MKRLVLALTLKTLPHILTLIILPDCRIMYIVSTTLDYGGRDDNCLSVLSLSYYHCLLQLGSGIGLGFWFFFLMFGFTFGFGFGFGFGLGLDF
jgi:hypothetical protein